jgi:hypothetical protein
LTSKIAELGAGSNGSVFLISHPGSAAKKMSPGGRTARSSGRFAGRYASECNRSAHQNDGSSTNRFRPMRPASQEAPARRSTDSPRDQADANGVGTLCAVTRAAMRKLPRLHRGAPAARNTRAERQPARRAVLDKQTHPPYCGARVRGAGRMDGRTCADNQLEAPSAPVILLAGKTSLLEERIQEDIA